MKRSLLTIRLFAIALMLLLGITFTGPAAQAAPLASAARSVWVVIRNNSQYPLSAQQSYITSGIWTVRPNAVIQPGQESGFGSESNGFMTGTHGSATYSVSNGQSFSLTWTNPYAGSNTYSSYLSTYSYGRPKVVMTRTGGSGNNAVVVLTIENACC
jgi:hypothetical protein